MFKISCKLSFIFFLIVLHLYYCYIDIRQLITFPIHKTVGSDDIHNILDARSKLTYKIYLSKELETDENDLILELRDMPYHWNSRKLWKRYIKDNKLYADGARQTRLEYLIDYFTHPNHRRRRPSLKILLPSHLLDGSCIYLTIITYNDSELYNVYKKKLSHLMVPNTKDLTKRYLLDNNSSIPDVGLLENVMIKHIPHTIQFGPVIEYRSTNIKDALNYGSNLLKYIDDKKYKLPIYYNDLIVPRDEYVPISPYCSESNGYKIDQDQKIYLNLVYQPISYERYLFHKIIKSILVNMEENININTYDTDSLMLMATDTSPYLIAMAYIIAILHLSLEIISLSSEIKFWKYHVEPEKLSTTSIWIDSLFQIIILLYLNHIGKSKLVIGVVAFQTLFNFYKLSKLFYIEYSGVLLVPFKLERYGSDKMFKTELDEFESVQVKRLYMFAFLFVLVYCTYTLTYVKHQSWSSWIISSLAVCSYTGGFLSMTPQLFRNYYLKSVEHMPWDTLIYKFINTIIDDFFSFIIRMPQMHRVSVFRDDVVFFVYAIQTIIYKTKAHVN